jgi:serine phosphatase RsbU (regulator of sigma subunit)/anti-sigma regulatory factor (Ser/Thr protein kinase)
VVDPKASKTVLIVDSDLDRSSALKELCQTLHYQVLRYPSLETAKLQAEEYLPDLVLMNLPMDNLGVISWIGALKESAGHTFLPVICLIDAVSEALIHEAVEAGADDFIDWPCSYEVLRAKLIALGRMKGLYHQIHDLHQIRQRDEEVAEQIFSRAIEKDNVLTDRIRLARRAAETFSGDLQLTARRPNGDVNILLGDFTGHGLTSVVGALPVAETFRAMTNKGYEAPEILKQINTKLCTLLPTGMFLAATWVTITPERQCMIWNGGMPDLLVLNPDGEVDSRFSSVDPPLGILKNMGALMVRSCVLQPDQRILMMSDGLSEARNFEGEYYGDERVLASVKLASDASSLLPSMMRDLDHFLKGFHQEDDISLIEVPASVISGPQADHLVLNAAMSDEREEETKSAKNNNDQFLAPTRYSQAAWCWRIVLRGKDLSRVNPVALAMNQLQEIEGAQEHWHFVFTVFTELFVNALDHGVLKLDSGMKTTAEGFSEYFTEREKRLSDLHSLDFVSLDLSLTREEEGGGLLKVVLNDSGPGFDVDSVLAKADCPQSPTSALTFGRGIPLVRQLCDSVTYDDFGTRVTAIYTW